MLRPAFRCSQYESGAVSAGRCFSKAFQRIVLLLFTLGGGLAAHAWQQSWSSQYVSWTFDAAPVEIYNIDQQVWIPEPTDASFWPLQWSWVGAGGVGGYLGLQQEGDSSQQVRFSLWNATEAKGPNCRTFGNEGAGYTCILPVTIDTRKFYRLRLWRTKTERDGQWWGGWLIEAGEGGSLVEHQIAQIKVPLAYHAVDPRSIKNFVEFFGKAVEHCSEVPRPVAGFTPPAVNYQGKGSGAYGGYSRYGGSARHRDNTCVTGQEEKGAFVTAKPYDFGFAAGVMVFLGGPALDTARHPTPQGMPAG